MTTKAEAIERPEFGDMRDDEYDDECDPEPDCLICGGDGSLEGDDPLWDEGDYVRCYSCGGSGLRKDMTVW